jgi:hypothetical protein
MWVELGVGYLTIPSIDAGSPRAEITKVVRIGVQVEDVAARRVVPEQVFATELAQGLVSE